MKKPLENELNATVWAKLAPSKIHGIGVFAIRSIPKGQKVYELGNRRWRKPIEYHMAHQAIQELIYQRWPLVIEGADFWSPNDDAHLPSFLNHSNTPNVDKHTFCALRDISTGEELVENYRPELMVDFGHEKA